MQHLSLTLADSFLTDSGKLEFFLSVGSAFVVAFLVSFAPMPRTLRAAALIAGPLANFGVFAFLISEDPCVRECVGKAAYGTFAVLAFVAWLVGAGIGYVLRKVIASSRGTIRPSESRPLP